MTKFTDEQIIKALECCFTNDFGKTNCNKCAFYTATAKCMDDMQNAVIDLINRQKAEIERLKSQNTLLLKKKCKDINIPRKIIKSKAIGVMIIELGKKEIKKTRSSDS